MTGRHLIAFAAVLALSACASTKQSQIRSALMDAGMNEPLAGCMAEPLAKDLSINQLRSLQRVAKLLHNSPKRMTEGQILDLLKRDLDPETVGVVIRAGFGCFIRG